MVIALSVQTRIGGMRIDLHSRGFALSDALREYTGRRLKFALARLADRVRRVTVRLCDIHGPRGGIDKCCRIRVMLDGFPSVLVEDTEADLYLAIDRAADRAGRTVMRRIAHRRLRPDGPDADAGQTTDL